MGDKQTCASQSFLVLLTDINSLDEEALTPLHYAARYKRERQRRGSEAVLTEDQEVRIQNFVVTECFFRYNIEMQIQHFGVTLCFISGKIVVGI